MIKKLKLEDALALKTDSSAPYAIYTENKNSTHLLVYFGSYNGEFRGHTTVRSLKCNGLFIRSRKASWYLESLPDLGETPEEISHTINNHIKSHPHIKTVTLAGFSMGAWAALLYSPWVKADKTVATAPQTVFPSFEVEKAIPPQPSGYWEQFSSIRKTWDSFGEPNHDVIIQCCSELDEDELWQDTKEVETLEHFKCVNVVRYDCKGHKGISPLLMEDIPSYEKNFMP